MDEVPCQWFALRATYNRSLKVQAALQAVGIRTFVPMRRVRRKIRGKERVLTMPAVGNLLFAFSTQRRLYEYILSEGDQSMTRFIWDRVSRLPLTVPDKQMEDFMRVCAEPSEDLVYVKTPDPKLFQGARVRVLRGALQGVEGRVVRIRKSRRVLVDLPGLLSVASTYVPVGDLQVISDD